MDEDLLWRVIGDRLAQGTAEHNICSFNAFLRHQLSHVLKESAELIATNKEGRTHVIRAENVHIQKPSITEADGKTRYVFPNECRRRSLTYAADVCADVVHDIVDASGAVSRHVFRSSVLTRLPIMLRSEACALARGYGCTQECVADQGGYFVVNGTEKALISQAKLRTNKSFVFETGAATAPGRHRTLEIRSVSESKLRSTSTMYLHINDVLSGAAPAIVSDLPFLTNSISLNLLYRLLKFEGSASALIDEVTEGHAAAGFSDAAKSILALALQTQCDVPGVALNFDEAFEQVGRRATREATAERRSKYMSHILLNELLPHCGLDVEPATLATKRFVITRAALRLISVALGEAPADDRDDLAERRVDAPGALIALLLRQLYRNGMRASSSLLAKSIEDPKREMMLHAPDLLFCKKTLAGLRYAFATGIWGVGRSGTAASNGQLGVAQVLSRLNSVSASASLRRVNTPLAREGRAAGPRQLHTSSWGYLCAAETPEGAACGLVTNLSLLASVRVGFPSECLLEPVLAAGAAIFDPLAPQHRPGNAVARPTIVLINGSPKASIDSNAAVFAERLRERRRDGVIPPDTSIAVENGDVVLCSDAGALIRPVIVASRFDLLRSLARETPRLPGRLWEELVRRGCIEWVDPLEQREAKVALWPEHLEAATGASYTHIEIHPSVAVGGLMMNLAPFAHQNPGPRSAYQAAQGKQAIGIYSTAFQQRVDVMAHVLSYPQRPLATTRVEELLPNKHTRAGALPIVAVLALGGHNQEDSLYMARGAIERGLFTSVYLQTIRDDARGAGADLEAFENPLSVDGCLGLKEARYDHLTTRGLPPVGAVLRPGDVVIGKTVACSSIQIARDKNEARRSIKRCKSTILKGDETVIVDEVLVSTAPDGAEAVKVRLRSVRVPRTGDKFSRRGS